MSDALAPMESERAGMVTRRRAALHAIRRQPSAALGLALVLTFCLVGLLAPWLAPYGPDQQVGAVFAPPSPAHPLGLDDGGNDMLSLLIYGARTSMLVGVTAAFVSIVIGGLVGLLAGYFGGWVELGLMRTTDYFLVLPAVPAMIVAAALWGSSLVNIIVVIGLLLWATTARIVAAQVQSVRSRAFVLRSRALGASHVRVIGHHILPQVAPLLVANTALAIAGAIFAETALSFLGLGDPSRVSWGRLIGNAFDRAAVSAGAWWAVVPPGVCVAIVILGCSLIGRAVEDALNPRLKIAHVSRSTFEVRGKVAE